MLYLKFYVGSQRFVVSVSFVDQVIPWVYPVEVFKNQSCMYGLLKFKGEIVPLVDLSMLFEKRYSQNKLSTRIIILEQQLEGKVKQKISLIAEKVMDTLTIDESLLQQNPLHLSEIKYVAKLLSDEDGVIKIIDTNQLFQLCDIDSAVGRS